MLNNEIKNFELRDRYILFTLVICLLGWLVSVANVRIYQFQNNVFSPFQSLPFIYWPLLIIVCYINLIPTKKNTKILSMGILGLMTLGTLSIIEPYGRMHDSWQNVALSKLIFQKGTVLFGYEYTQSYPSLFILFGTLQQITNISVGSLVRMTPLLLMIAYIFGSLLAVDSIALLFKYNPKKSWEIASISFLFLVIFGLSILGLRINPAPQSIAYILFIYFIYSSLKDRIERRIISLIICITIVTTHFITPLVMFFSYTILTFTLTFTNRSKNLRTSIKRSSRVIFPLIVFASWTIYQAFYYVKYGINYIQYCFNAETKIGANVPMSSLPVNVNEYFIINKQVTIIIVGSLILYSLVIVIKKEKYLGISLFLFWLGLTPGLLFYLVASDFSSRFFELSTFPLSLIFGFGIYEALKRKSILKHIIIILILIASTTSIYTANNGDIYNYITKSEIVGSKFINANTDPTKLIYGFRLPVENYSALWRCGAPTENIDPDFSKLNNNTIAVSDCWTCRQLCLSPTKNSLSQLEYILGRESRFKKIYDNKKFRIYST